VKITIIQGAFLPVPTRRGGAVEKIWFALGREFARRGHEVLHVSRHCDDLPAAETIDGVRHRRVRGHDAPLSRWLLKGCDLLYTRRVAAQLPPADIVVTNTFWAPLLLRARQHGLIWVHVQRYPQHQMRLYRRAAILQTVSRVIADAIIAQTPSVAPRVRIIPNPLPTIAAAARDVARDPNLILFVGRVHPEKGLELLLRALQVLRQSQPRARLRLVGPAEERYGGGGEQFLRELRALAAPLGAAVTLAGPVFDEAELSAHYEEAAVFVYPSLAAKGEASPVAPLEAMAHGLPVVISDLACFDDLMPAAGACGQRFNHLAADAPVRLAATLGSLLARSPVETALTAAAARARAAQFSVARVADQYLAGFASLLPAPSRRP
jgi:glycosyltransferase involved in cell wall biosynthesis